MSSDVYQALIEDFLIGLILFFGDLVFFTKYFVCFLEVFTVNFGFYSLISGVLIIITVKGAI